MRFKSLFIILLVAVAAVAGWLAGRQTAGPGGSAQTSSGPRVAFYQSPMHPWIKSDQPGNCTICGMKLVPVLEGQQPVTAENAGEPTVMLGSQSASVLRVETGLVTRQPLQRTLRVSGAIDDDDSAHRRLSAYVDGRIDKLMVNFVGAEVVQGEVLAHLYSPALLTARNEYLLLTRQAGAAVSDRLLGAARQRLIRLGLTEEQVNKLPQDKAPSDFIEILAPISGTVVERKVYEGQYVKEGDVLFEIANFDRMWFVADVYERDLAWIRVGQMVDVTTPSLPGRVFSAPIDFIDPNLMPATRTARVRVILENPHIGDPADHYHELKHKVFAEGIVHVETPEALTVPRSAVLSGGTGATVYVVRGEGVYEPRQVTLGRAGDALWEVTEGLKEGERIVASGNLMIDAQAQLDRGGAPLGGAAQADTAGDAATGSAPEKDADMQAFLSAAARVSDALASDDLGAYNSGLTTMREAVSVLGTRLGDLAGLANLQSAKDLAGARKDFYPFSMALAEFAQRLRKEDKAFASLKVYECPMVKTAVPSAPRDQGRWVQLAAPRRNPYMGGAMESCGLEVME